MVVGIAGKSGSGKSTLASKLRVWLDAEIFAFADALKGSLHRRNLEVYFPQLNNRGRELLQTLGEATKRKNRYIWVDIVGELIRAYPRVVIEDVRFKEEVELIRGCGGEIVYLISTKEFAPKHISESLEPSLCNKQFTMEEAEDYFLERYGIARKPRIYLGGNIFAEKDFKSKFIKTAEHLEKNSIIPLLPELDAVEPIDQLNGDLAKIDQADGAFFLLSAPSLGVGIELFALRLQQKPVWFLSSLDHGWLNLFGEKTSSLNMATEKIQNFWRIQKGCH